MFSVRDFSQFVSVRVDVTKVLCSKHPLRELNVEHETVQRLKRIFRNGNMIIYHGALLSV